MIKAVAIASGVMALLIAAVVMVPAFVDLGVFKSTYLPLVEDTFHRNIDVDNVRFTLLPTPSIRLSNLKVSDNPASPQSATFDAGQVDLRLALWSLLRGRFEVTEFVMNRPVVNLLKRTNGAIHDSVVSRTIGPAANRQDKRKNSDVAKSEATSQMPLLVPRRLRVKNGQLNFETEGKKPLRISGIDLLLRDFSREQPFPYRASFKFPGLKTISLEGQLDYQAARAILKLRDTRLKVYDLVLPVEGSVSSLSAAPRLNLALASEHVDALQVFEILSVLGLAPRDIKVSGAIGLHMTVAGPSNALVTRVQGRFQDIKIHDKRALKGTLSGGMSIRLPLVSGSALVRLVRGEGRLIAHDGELTNVNLVKKIDRVTGLMGFSRDERRQATSFETFKAECRLGNGMADFKHIYLVNPQLEITGRGTMTLDRSDLNLAIEAKLSAQASARAGRGRATTFFKDHGRIVVPLRITGPVRNPTVDLDNEKMAQRGVTRSLEKSLGSFFKQLFHR